MHYFVNQNGHPVIHTAKMSENITIDKNEEHSKMESVQLCACLHQKIENNKTHVEKL